MSNPIVDWSYESRADELEAIRWYLTRRLDQQTKLDPELGIAVNAYEHLRHVVKLPDLGRFIRVPLKPFRTSSWLWADRGTAQWLKIPEFPKLPFTKLCAASQNTVLGYFNAEYPAFYPMDITEVADWGVLKELSKLAKDAKHSERRVVAEVELSESLHSVIVFSIDFSAGAERAEHWFKRWHQENKHRFAKTGRSQAGTRAKNNPLGELKDLAVARLLALHSFNQTEASRWARTNRPLDAEGRVIRWFNRRNAKKPGGGASRLFNDPRNWDRAARRFEKNLRTFLVSQ